MVPNMRLLAEKFCRQQCNMHHGLHSATARVLPSKRLKCTAMAKGFADRKAVNVDPPTGESKQRLRKKADRRKRISHELEELQTAELRSPAGAAPLPQSQQSNGSQPNAARPTQQQQQLRPEEVASLATKLEEEVLKLREEIRSSTFYRYSRCQSHPCVPGPLTTLNVVSVQS